MLIWIKEILMQLLIWILGFIDSVFKVFRSVAGLDGVGTPNGEQTLSEYFLNLDGVQWAFWVVFIASIGICAVCTVVAVVKNVINFKGGEQKSHARTLGQATGTVIVSLVMAMMLIVGVGVSDKLLGVIDKSMNGSNSIIMSHEIIALSVSDSYLYDTGNVQGLNKDDEDGNCTYVSPLYLFATVGSEPKKEKRYGKDYIVYLDPDGITDMNFYDVYEQVLDADGKPLLDEDGNEVWEPNVSKLTPVKSTDGWNRKPQYGYGEAAEYYTKNDLPENMWDARVEGILGDTTGVFGIPYKWDRDGMVADPDNFNFIIAYICAIVLLIALIGATFGLVKRLFDIVILFIVLPGISATIPLDDGAKFKLWRETVISKVFLAFGTVIAVNVFLIVAPSLLSISIGTAESSLLNSVLRLVLVCGGALTISGGQLLFARLLGTSAEESREMGQSARTLFGGAMTALGGAKAAGRLAFGYRNANGQRVGGLIKGGAGALGAVGGGAANAIGSMIGGQAYRNSKVGKGVAATQKALKGFGSSAGWIGQDRSTGGATLGGAIGGGMGKLGNKFVGSNAAQKSGLNNGVSGAVGAARNEHAAKARSNDIAAAFGVDPKDVRHVSYGAQAANGSDGVGVGSMKDVTAKSREYAKSQKKK